MELGLRCSAVSNRYSIVASVDVVAAAEVGVVGPDWPIVPVTIEAYWSAPIDPVRPMDW